MIRQRRPHVGVGKASEGQVSGPLVLAQDADVLVPGRPDGEVLGLHGDPRMGRDPFLVEEFRGPGQGMGVLVGIVNGKVNDLEGPVPAPWPRAGDLEQLVVGTQVVDRRLDGDGGVIPGNGLEGRARRENHQIGIPRRPQDEAPSERERPPLGMAEPGQNVPLVQRIEAGLALHQQDLADGRAQQPIVGRREQNLGAALFDDAVPDQLLP